MKNRVVILMMALFFLLHALDAADKAVEPTVSPKPAIVIASSVFMGVLADVSAATDSEIESDDSDSVKKEIAFAFIVDQLGAISLKPKKIQASKVISKDEMLEKHIQSRRAAAGHKFEIEEPKSKIPRKKRVLVGPKAKSSLAILASSKREYRKLHPEVLEFFSKKRK